MSKLLYGAGAVIVLWIGVKLGLLDALVGGIVGDFAAELDRLTGPLSVLLAGVAVVVGMVAVGLLLHRATRTWGVELLVFAGIVLALSRLVPVAGHWIDGEAAVTAANLSRAPVVAPASLQVQAAPLPTPRPRP
jgi:hypothetical protein